MLFFHGQQPFARLSIRSAIQHATKSLLRLVSVVTLGSSTAVFAVSSDLLIQLDPDGLGYTIQHTIGTYEHTVELTVPDSARVLNVQFFMPSSNAPEEQVHEESQQLRADQGYVSSEDKIVLYSGVVVLLYQHPIINNLKSLENSNYQLSLLPLPVSFSPINTKLDRQTTTWLFPTDMVVNSYQNPNQTGYWREEHNALKFLSEHSELEQQFITYSWLDQDTDGISNSLDRCIDTPKGYPVDAAGCSQDTDQDGIVDGLDRCAASLASYPVDKHGCTLDFDNDGVPNPIDQCRHSSANHAVDQYGCEADSDRDGMVDHLDRCPDTPRLVKVDNNGCPSDEDSDSIPDYRDICASNQPTQSTNEFGCQATKRPIIIEGVSFLTGSSNLSFKAREILNRVAASIDYNADIESFEIGAHTDDQGTRANNKSLSERRANTVRQYLMIKGVSPNRIVAVGYGESTPLVPNTSQANRTKNRRIELRVGK